MGNICDIFKNEPQNKAVSPIVLVSTPSYIKNDISGNISIDEPDNNNFYQKSKAIPINSNLENNLQQVSYSLPKQPVVIYNNTYPYHVHDNFTSGLVGGLLIAEIYHDESY